MSPIGKEVSNNILSHYGEIPNLKKESIFNTPSSSCQTGDYLRRVVETEHRHL